MISKSGRLEGTVKYFNNKLMGDRRKEKELITVSSKLKAEREDKDCLSQRRRGQKKKIDGRWKREA